MTTNPWGLYPVDDETTAALEAKCQENGWLMRGGYDWQDDPYLEEYPYTFSATDSIDGLRGFFESGNWAIRQGVLFRDIAFIQQVNGGDEWWTLKKTDDGWLSFESISFENMAVDPERFNHMICSLVASAPEFCKALDYLPPEKTVDDIIGISDEYGLYDIQDSHPDPVDLRIYVIRSIQQTPEAVADWLQTIGEGAENARALELAQKLLPEKVAAKAVVGEESLSDKAGRVQRAASAAQLQRALAPEAEKNR